MIQTYRKRDLRRLLLAGWLASTGTRDTEEEVRLSLCGSAGNALAVFSLVAEGEDPPYPPPPAYNPQPEVDRNTLVPDVR